MQKINLFLKVLIFSVVLTISLGFPMSDEDDEYDDDPEYPERNHATMLKLQEEFQNQQQYLASLTTSTTTTTPKPLRTFPPKQKKKWLHAENIRGYQVLSDGPRVQTELIRTRPMLRIRIDIPDTIRDVEKIFERRHVELKIRNWNKVYKVHVRVPFGYQPSDLRILEMRDHVDIIAPIYSEITETEGGYKSDVLMY